VPETRSTAGAVRGICEHVFVMLAVRLVRHLTEAPEGEELLRPSRVWLLAIPSAYVIAVVGSALYGTPAKLPGVALGLPLLLDLERAAAVLAVTAGVLIFALLTSRGHLPTQFGNVAYPAVGRQEELTRRVAELDQRLERRLVPLEEGSRTNDEALPLITSELTELSRRLNAVESPRGG
jgi:hypothetical protein